MAIGLIASYQLKSSAQGTTALTTPSFTPSNGEVITIGMESWDTTVTMTASNTGSQTVVNQVTEQPGGFNSFCRIATIVVSGSPGSMTISGTPSASARYSMTVERWSSAQLAATPVTNANTNTTGAAQSTITPSAAGSVIVWVSSDSQSVDPSTRTYAGSGTDDGIRDDHVGANGVGYHGYQTSTGNTSQTYGLTAPTGQKWVICGIEVQASGGSAPAFPPNRVASRGPRLPESARLPRRGRTSTPVRAQVNPPFPFNQVKQPRGLRGLFQRRGHAFTPVRPQVNPPFPFTGVKQPRELRGLLPRRPRAASPVPAQVIVTAPTFPPQSVRTRLRGLRWPRGRSSAPPVDQAVAIASGWRARLRGMRPLRSRVAAPVPPQLVAPPVYPPAAVRTRLRFLRPFRPHVTGPVSGQDSPPASAARIRAKWARVRPHLAAPPIDQTITAQPARSRLRLPRLSRGHTVGPVPPQTAVAAPPYPPQSVRTRLRGLRIFRGRAAAVVPPQIVVTPPGYPPTGIRIRVRGLRLFRGRSATPVPPQATVTPPVFVPLAVRSRLKWSRWFRPRTAAAPVGQPPATPPAPHARTHPMAPRRGRTATPLAPQPMPPVAPARPRPKGLRPDRPRAAGPVPQQTAAIAPLFPPMLGRAKRSLARLARGVARFVPFTDTTPVVSPRNPTVTVDLARAVATADLTRPTAVADLSRVATVADLSRTTVTADLTRPSVTVAL